MNANINHDFFIWEENKNIQLQNNNCKQEEKDNCVIITETKTDLMQNAWKNITDPKERRKAYQKAYYEINKDKKNESQKIQSKVWYETNKDKRKVYLESNKEKIKVKKKAYREVNKDKNKIYKKNYDNKRKTDIQYKLRKNLRIRLHHAINRNQKVGSAVKDMGCTVDELTSYLESKFQPGMTWDNWGINGWHIDHIKPLSSFDLTDRKQFLEACHYTNLQPLWAKDNLIKRDVLI